MPSGPSDFPRRPTTRNLNPLLRLLAYDRVLRSVVDTEFKQGSEADLNPSIAAGHGERSEDR